MRTALIESILDQARVDERVAFLTGDLGYMAVEPLAEALGDRFINAGVAEVNMIGVAAGMAAAGYRPFVYSMIPFVSMRCLETIRVCLCQHNIDVTLIGIGSGYSYGNQGASHHAIEDLACMLSLPNMTVITPSDPYDVRQAVMATSEIQGPCYIRLAKNNSKTVNVADRQFEFGRLERLVDGPDGAMFVMGEITEKCFAVCSELAMDHGINLSLYNCHTLKPFDHESLRRCVTDLNRRHVFVVEQHVEHGGLNSLVSQSLIGSGITLESYNSMAIKDAYVTACGDQLYHEKNDGLDQNSILQTVLHELKDR
jgi:transketolase